MKGLNKELTIEVKLLLMEGDIDRAVGAYMKDLKPFEYISLRLPSSFNSNDF